MSPPNLDWEQIAEGGLEPRAASNPFVLALKPLVGSGIPEIADPAVRLRAGIIGLVLGVLVFPVGFAIGSVVMPRVLRAIYGPGPGEVYIPRVLVVLVFGLAIWGGVMGLVGGLRILQCLLKRYVTLAAIVVLPVVAIGYLLVLMMLFLRV